MRAVGAFEAKTKLSELLVAVAKGEKIAITKHGKNIAMLVPVQAKTSLTTMDAIHGIQVLRKKIASRGVKFTLQEIQEMKEIGRK